MRRLHLIFQLFAYIPSATLALALVTGCSTRGRFPDQPDPERDADLVSSQSFARSAGAPTSEERAQSAISQESRPGSLEKMDTLPAPGGRLTLQASVESALRNNVETRIFRVREMEADAGIDREKGAFDLDMNGEMTTGNNQFSAGDASYGLEKRLATGTEILAEGGPRLGDESYIGETRSSSDLGVRVRQPLLRGAGVKYNRSGIQRARLIAEAADLQTEAQIFETLRQVETSYWAASTYQELVVVRKESLSRTEKILEDVKARLEIGAATRIDVLEAEASCAAAKSELVQAKKSYRDEMDNLQILLGMELIEGHGDWELNPATRFFDEKAGPTVKEVFENAMENAPAIAMLNNDVEQRKIEAFRAKRDSLPRLDLEVESIRRSDTVSQIDSSEPWDTLGLLRVSMPWGNRERKAAYEEAASRLEESRLSKWEGERRLKQQIFEVTRRIESGREELSVASHALRVNRAKWEEQLKRSEEGLITTRILKESEQELREAEVSENTARLRLIAAWSLLTRLDGSIAERLGVAVHTDFTAPDSTALSQAVENQ